MDAQELRNLQEAYMEVYEEKGDIKDRDEKASKQKADARMSGTKEITVYQSSAGYISKDEGEQRLNTVKKKINKELEKRKEKVRNRNLTFSRTKGDDALKMGKSPRNQKEQLDIYDIILSHLLDEGYAETPEAAEVIMVNMSEEWRESIMEGMTMKDFKANRQKNKRRAASVDAEKRGHVGKEWYNSGRKYSPDEAKRMRSKLDDEERRTRHRSAVDPDNEDDNNYSADKTKNPKKLRKQRAMGEHG